MARSKRIDHKLKKEADEYWFEGGFRRCPICNSNKRIQYHHIYLDGGDPYTDTEAENLIPLCSVCHHKIEYFPDSRLAKLMRTIAKEKREEKLKEKR